MRKTLLATLLLVASTPTLAGDVWDQYKMLATDVTKQIESGSLSDVKSKAIALTRLSTQLLPTFVKKQPVCSEYINAAMQASERMLSISLDEIEADYHADGKLPSMKQPVCYHAKDLLVHPATVAVIAKTLPDSKETREKLHHEIVEVLEHFNEVKRDAGM